MKDVQSFITKEIAHNDKLLNEVLESYSTFMDLTMKRRLREQINQNKDVKVIINSPETYDLEVIEGLLRKSKISDSKIIRGVDEIRVDVPVESIDIKVQWYPETKRYADHLKEKGFAALDIARKLKEYFENPWNWCIICVKADYLCFSASTYVKGCSYESANDFIQKSDHYKHMVDEVTDSIQREADIVFKSLMMNSVQLKQD